MDKITKAEYRILRACARKSCKFEYNQVSALLGNKYIMPDYEKNKLNPSETEIYYGITHDGQVAYEHYHDLMYEQRMVSFRTWLALALSVISIVVAIVNVILMAD